MAARFWVGGTGTWDASDTTHWAATSGAAGGQSVPVAGDTVTFDGSSGGGTVTVNHATLNLASITWGAFTGTLDFSANNNNVTLTGTAAFNGSGTGATRNINLGNGTWTMSATGGASLWVMTTTTGLGTFNANSSTLLFSGAGSTIRGLGGGGLTYNTVSIAGGDGGFNITGANTFATLTVAAPNTLLLPAAATTTITNAFNLVGTAADPISMINTGSSAATISTAAGSPTLTWGALRQITFSGGATFTATNSLDLGLNTGITITPPTSGVVGVIGG